MAANQPPPNTVNRADEKKVQLFLERAAPIVLESRVLDTANWQRLVALARELELTDGQLRTTIDDLRQRGVIERVELQSGKPAGDVAAKPSPKPPPLPVRPTLADAAANPGASRTSGTTGQGHDATPDASSAREKTFSLNSPSPPQPPPPPPPASARPKGPSLPTSSGPASPPSDVPTAPSSPRPLPRSDRGRTGGPDAKQGLHAQLAQRAAAIIAEQRGFSPKTHTLIAAAAEDLGLTDEDAATVIKSLHQGDRTPKDPPADDANYRQRWKEEGKPEPPRHEAPKKPHEIFTAFVAKSLDKLAVGHVSRDLEEGLVAHGTKVLKLSQVYASQLVRDVAQEKDLLLESVTKQETAANETASLDPRLTAFLDRAAPILAQNRGLNARSRVLLGAMAEEVGLPPDEVDAAVALLESKPGQSDGQEIEQRARMAPFRRYVSELLGQLPQPILTARVHTMMVERADERFGIDAEQAQAVMRELASAQEIQIITEAEALDHIENLVADHLGEALRLDTSVRHRILKEGNQWGLSAEQVELIVKQQSRKNYKRRQSERNLSNAALVAAMVAVLLVIGFLGWAMLGGRMTPVEPDPVPQPIATAPTTPADDTDDSWWSVDLVLAVHNATIEFPLLRRTLKAIGAPDSEHRARAYDSLIRHALYDTDDDVGRNMLLNVISLAYVVEPDDTTAGKIRQSLLHAVPGPEDRLSEREEDYARVFLAMRGAVAAMHAAADVPNRADDMARSIGQVVGTTIDRHQALIPLERQCLGALAERLFRLMIASTPTRPADTLPLHAVIAEEAGRYLDRAQLDSLNTDFLAAFLANSDDSWRDVQTLIDASVDQRDPLVVAKMIDIYESTTNASLQSHLQSRLLRRASLKPTATDARNIASELRQALGIIETATAAGRTLDFVRLANRELALTSDKESERLKAAESAIRLSQVATIGCALAQGDAGFAMFDVLIKKELGGLTPEPIDDDSLFPTDVGTDWDALERIDSALARLPREGAANRVQRVESIADLASRVRDLKPPQANLLAAYLLLKKSASEHTRVLALVPKFRHWSHLLLGVSDRMLHAEMEPDQWQATLSQLLDETITLNDDESDRESIRGALLRRAATELDVAGSTVADPDLIDRTPSLLRDQYLQQASLLGVPQPALAEAGDPAAVLKAIIEHQATRMIAAADAKDTAPQLADIPHQMQAIEYVTTNGLQQTVLLERLWLQLLAAEIKRDSTEASEEAERIMRDLLETDRNAPHAFAQLQASQASIVQMWMLRTRTN